VITDSLPRMTNQFGPARAHPWMMAVCGVALFLVNAAAKPVLPAGLAGFPAGGPTSTATQIAADADDDGPLGAAQFDTTSVPLPPNAASVGHEAAATSEFGDLVRLSGAAHFIDSVTVTLSSWAIRSDYPGSSPLGFTHPVVLKLYAVDRSSGTPRAGAVLATLSHDFLIPVAPGAAPRFDFAAAALARCERQVLHRPRLQPHLRSRCARPDAARRSDLRRVVQHAASRRPAHRRARSL
jgi:hypothetical protein